MMYRGASQSIIFLTCQMLIDECFIAAYECVILLVKCVPYTIQSEADREIEQNGCPKMKEHTLKAIAIQNDGYEAPELNDTLYLHFKGQNGSTVCIYLVA